MPLLPQPLKPNSTIGLICPAGGFVDYKPIERVIKYLNKQGFKVKVGKSIVCSSKAYKYLSGPDFERLSDLLDCWNDKSIDAIFCLRGGYGSLRLLNDIDFKQIKKSKKIIIGFSDITVLLLAIYAKTNLITFHGPLLGINFINKSLNPKDKASANKMWQLLADRKFKFSYSYRKGKTIYPGKAHGTLLGGNLTEICSMIGSGFLPDFKNAILFLEDCYEEPCRVDRLLTQLVNADVLKKIRGLIFSNFMKCKFKSDDEVVDLIKDRIKGYKVPTIYNFPIGHTLKNYAVPIGQKVVLDASNLTLQTS